MKFAKPRELKSNDYPDSCMTQPEMLRKLIAEIGNPVMRDSDLTLETDFRKKHRDRKIGMTRTGTEEITVQGHTIRTKKRIVGNV